MSPQARGLAHSVHVRLIAHAKELRLEPNFVLNRFAIERILYRLSRSAYCDSVRPEGRDAHARVAG